jgi:general stress protein YciG
MDKPKTINEVAAMGGKAILEKYGREYYQELGKKGGASLKAKYGDDYFRRIRYGEKIKNS